MQSLTPWCGKVVLEKFTFGFREIVLSRFNYTKFIEWAVECSKV